MSGIKLLLDSNRGRYIPQNFVEEFDLSKFSIPDRTAVNICARGDTEDNEGYWDAWTSILDNATFKENGHTWHLYQDGDLFAICDELMDDEEYENFFGEAREE